MKKQPKKASAASGPASYENWIQFNKSPEWYFASEYPLFTDTRLIGECTAALGPYKIFNTVPDDHDKQTKPSLILRCTFHGSPKSIDWTKKNADNYHGGWLPDELAALISLAYGIRLYAGNETRYFRADGDPAGRPSGRTIKPDPVPPSHRRDSIAPALYRDCRLDDWRLIITFPKLSLPVANSLIKAARMYQEAVWVIETEPHLSWLHLTSAIETLTDSKKYRGSLTDLLREFKPELTTKILEIGNEEVLKVVAQDIAPAAKATKKYVDFLLQRLPPEPTFKDRPPKYAQHEWSATQFKKSFLKIYEHRSHALHTGIPVPGPMSSSPYLGRLQDDGPLPEKFPGLGGGVMTSHWLQEDLPMLLWMYERIVRHAMLDWWKEQVLLHCP